MPDSSSALRVVMLTHHPLGRGADFLRAWYLSRELIRMGHQVTLVCSEPSDPKLVDTWQGGATAEVALIGGRDQSFAGLVQEFQSARRRRAFLAEREVDVVHTFGPRPSVQLPARFMAKRLGAAHVADWSDWWGYGGIASQRLFTKKVSMGLLDHLSERWVLASADAVTVVNPWALKRLSWLRASKGKVINLGLGASSTVIRPLSTAEARQRLQIQVDSPVVGYSGQSAFDQPFLGKTLTRLVELIPEVTLLLIGRRREEWFKMGMKGATMKRACCVSHVPHFELSKFLCAADLMLLPLPAANLHLARMPLRLGDYMAAGVPVVTTDVGDAAELVQTEGVGIVSPPAPKAMAQAVVGLLAAPAERRRMGRTARQLAETKYSWESQAIGLAELYRTLT